MTNEHIAMMGNAYMSWLYPIYVPSYSRAGTAPLLNMLDKAPRKIQELVHIVVRPGEFNAYKSEYPWATVIFEAQPGIGPARMRALIHAELEGYKRIAVLDDDIIHVSLLETITTDSGKEHTRRYSSKVGGIPEPMLLIRSLATACKLSDMVFRQVPTAAYGAARNALFSGDVDTSVGATLNKGSFPACVMFFDVRRFSMRDMPEPYHYHGEDLAMFLNTLSSGMAAFTLPGVAYDQHGSIDSTIPLDPQDEVGRPHLDTTDDHYPYVHPYLRVSMRNKLGGVMRIGVNWSRWYKATESEPVEIPLSKLTSFRHKEMI